MSPSRLSGTYSYVLNYRRLSFQQNSYSLGLVRTISLASAINQSVSYPYYSALLKLVEISSIVLTIYDSATISNINIITRSSRTSSSRQYSYVLLAGSRDSTSGTICSLPGTQQTLRFLYYKIYIEARASRLLSLSVAVEVRAVQLTILVILV